MYRVRSGAIDGMPQLVRELGANPIKIIEQVGLRESQFRDPDSYVPYEKLAEILELSASHCKAPLFGLRLAERQTSIVLGELALAASAGTSVEEALAIAAKHLYLHASGVQLTPLRGNESTQLALSFAFNSTLGTNQLMQMSVGHLAIFSAELLGVDRFSLTLHFSQADPGKLRGSESRFRRLRFEQTFDGIALTSKQLSKTRHYNEQRLNTHLQNYLQQLQQRYPESLEDQIGDIISHLLPAGECSVEQVAATLGMHPRTLQIKLKGLGNSYRQILQETRTGLARQHLSHEKTSITDLALQLGYADIAVFSRHFKRWTGLSPSAWQRRALDKTP